MIARSRSFGVLALVAAVLIHGALGWALMSGADVQIESSAGAQEARIGTSFADMTAGTLEALPATETAQPLAPESPAEASSEVAPEVADPVSPVEAVALPAPQPAETPRAAPDLASDVVPTGASRVAPEPAEAARVDAAQAAEPAQPAIDADAPQAVSQSIRPKRRSAAFEQRSKQAAEAARPKPQPKPQPKPTPQPAQQPRGNAEQSATAGAATGNAAAKPATSGSAEGRATSSGNAAASNYPGQVMQRLSRVPRPSAGSRGTAVVAFSVSASGGLASVSIARSSGSAALDRAALRMVQSAAPFPAPPPGAQRSFSISIKGR